MHTRQTNLPGGSMRNLPKEQTKYIYKSKRRNPLHSQSFRHCERRAVRAVRVEWRRRRKNTTKTTAATKKQKQHARNLVFS